MWEIWEREEYGRIREEYGKERIREEYGADLPSRRDNVDPVQHDRRVRVPIAPLAPGGGRRGAVQVLAAGLRHRQRQVQPFLVLRVELDAAPPHRPAFRSTGSGARAEMWENARWTKYGLETWMQSRQPGPPGLCARRIAVSTVGSG